MKPEELIGIRLSLSLTQKGMARLSGVSHSMYNLYERGKAPISVKAENKIHKAHKKQLDYIKMLGEVVNKVVRELRL